MHHPDPSHHRIHQGLAGGLVATLLLPVVLALLGGLAGLLAALGDRGAAAVCGFIALGVGVVWLVALVATIVLSALAVLLPPPPPRPRKRRRTEPGVR